MVSVVACSGLFVAVNGRRGGPFRCVDCGWVCELPYNHERGVVS